MNLSDLDYIEDKSGNFWIIHGGGDTFYCNLVFSPDGFGERVNKKNDRNYSKVILDNMGFVPIEDVSIARVLNPRTFFEKNYSLIPEDWRKIPDSINSLGISKSSLGIFGSFLLGFDVVKDIDFVVYGKENCKTVLENLDLLRSRIGCEPISQEHIQYQVKKYGKIYSSENDFQKILSRNRAGMQMSSTVLSTVRFVYNRSEEPRDIAVQGGKEITLEGKVGNSFGFNFVPRIASVDSEIGNIRLLTYNWMFKSCLRDGDKVKVHGEYCEDNRTLYLSKKEHWLKYLN